MKLFQFKFLYLLLIVLNQNILFSYNISGFIKDATNGEPIAFSNTTLSNIDTKEILRGTASDINGYFIIADLNQGKYQLNISIIGYELYIEDILIVDENIRIPIKGNITSLQ